MNLALWIPLLFGLGIVALALMFAFVIACDKI
jgi:type IV secretory pathway TrbD component